MCEPFVVPRCHVSLWRSSGWFPYRECNSPSW